MVEEEKNEEQISQVIGNIEKELGAYKKLNVQNPFDEKMIEKQIMQIMVNNDESGKKERKNERNLKRRKTRFIY